MLNVECLMHRASNWLSHTFNIHNSSLKSSRGWEAVLQPLDDLRKGVRRAGAFLRADAEAVVVAGRRRQLLVARRQRVEDGARVAWEDGVVAAVVDDQRRNRHLGRIAHDV